MAKLPVARVTLFIALLVFAVFVIFANPKQPQNHPPVVKIIKPKTGSSLKPGAQAGYEITVSDKEDGESKFDEINPKEVLLQVQYIKDTSKKPALNGKVINDPPGLAAIRASNCFNCHAFTGRLIGPSFYDISKKYPATPANISAVAGRVKEGSPGIWGKVTMPTHPELSVAQTQDMASWILQNGGSTDVDYYIGTQGVIHLPTTPSPNGYYLLTASYIDHGLKDDSTKPRLKGQDEAVIYLR